MTGAAHPTWCSPGRCEVGFGGAHSSEPVTLDFDSNGSAFGRLRIWERPGAVDLFDMDKRRRPGTRVEAIFGDIDTGKRCRSDLTARQALQLAELLDVLNGQIGGSS